MPTNRRVRRIIAAVLLPLCAAIVLACTDTVFKDRDRFNPPPDESSGFLGYFTPAQKLTTCGNCHVTTQASWVQTAHAGAFETLVDIGAPATCYQCHTVNERGNGATGPAGWNKVEDAAYHDVQCESCHGPGLTHVTTPDNHATWPLARIAIGDTAASCAACHNGTHHPFVEQWGASGHGDSVANDHPATTPGCQSCHEGKAAIVALSGGSTNYVERDSANTITITCSVCHDPHGSPNSKQLRAPIDVPDVTINLCMRCHNRNATPSSTFSIGERGPHSVQGAILLGEGAGYIPPGFIYDTSKAFTSHASIKNPRLCAGCHVNSFDVTDPNTGSFIFKSVGHLFRPVPCVNAQGVPLADNTCAYTATARNWSGCAASGCHGDANVAVSAFTNERNNVAILVNQLWQDLNGNLALDAAPTDGGFLADILAADPSQFVSTDNTLSPAEGALFNAMMLGEKTLNDHDDGSYGVHNPFYYEALLSATVADLQNTYDLGAPPVAVKRLMEKALSRPGVRYDAGLAKAQAVSLH